MPFHSCLFAHKWIIPEMLPQVVCLMVARSWLVQVLHVLPQVFGLLKWHWLPGVSSWLVRVIPYSTLSFSTQSYRVRLRAVISYVQNIQLIYKKREELLWTHLIYECRINNVISNFIIFGILILKFFCSSAHCIIICCARGYQYNIWRDAT